MRDPRGFAVKLYTEEGNWDLVGNNTPIFFIRDPLMVSCTLLMSPLPMQSPAHNGGQWCIATVAISDQWHYL